MLYNNKFSYARGIYELLVLNNFEKNRGYSVQNQPHTGIHTNTELHIKTYVVDSYLIQLNMSNNTHIPEYNLR